MTALSAQTLIMAIQGVSAEIHRLMGSVNGDVTALGSDEQELLLAYSQAAEELKIAYLELRKLNPKMPDYAQLVKP